MILLESQELEICFYSIILSVFSSSRVCLGRLYVFIFTRIIGGLKIEPWGIPTNVSPQLKQCLFRTIQFY